MRAACPDGVDYALNAWAMQEYFDAYAEVLRPFGGIVDLVPTTGACAPRRGREALGVEHESPVSSG